MDLAYTAHQTVNLPVEVTQDRPEYVYVPLRGYCAILAVFDLNDRCIGWINTRTLGYNTAQEWIQATRWVDQGY